MNSNKIFLFPLLQHFNKTFNISSKILLSELEVYIKVWPCTLLMVGICQSLQELCRIANPLSKSIPNNEKLGKLYIQAFFIK